MAFRLIPKEEKFYQDFLAVADELKNGARLLEEMLAGTPPLWDKAEEIKEVEHKCDFLSHEVYQRLHRTFVTPLDREDILGLASRLDDVADLANDVAELILIYKIDRVRPAAVRQAKILVAATDELVLMMQRLEGLKDLQEHWIKLHTFENEGDHVFREAIGELFGAERDAIELVKWKDLFERIEIAIDRCEDIANIVETIKIKHS